MFIIVEHIKTHTVVLWFAVYSVRVLARRKHHGGFGAKVSIVSLRAYVHNATFIIARAADSRFSHGRRQLPFKSVQWAKPLLMFCWCNLLIMYSLRSRCLEVVDARKDGRARGETCEGRGRPLACLLPHPFFLVPTSSKHLLHRLSNIVLEICSTTRKVFFHFEPLALPTEELPHEN